ncbi:MAG: hypothetical protein LAT79_09800 [Kiritimatiellae bacterium]|nr:hypothetical protein [Kiritimatiellia bacterium]
MARVRLLKAGGDASCGGGPGQDGPRPAVESWRRRILRREDRARMARVRLLKAGGAASCGVKTGPGWPASGC